MSETALETEDGRLKFMSQVIALDYEVRVPPIQTEFARRLRERKIVGHRCPSCGNVYVPSKGYCPMCVVETTWEDHAVEVADQGIVTAWTVLTPIQYHGQTEREDYALASILLDGADGTIGVQRLVDVDLPDIRMGMRVAAVWADDPEDDDGPIGYGLGNAVEGFRPTGEPDADRSAYEHHVL